MDGSQQNGGKEPRTNMRPCIKKAFEQGSRSGVEFEVMRHAIIAELKRLGYNRREIQDHMTEWNARCEMPLTGSVLKSNVLNYVTWCMKREVKVGCKGLKDFCLCEGGCWYRLSSEEARRKVAQEPLPFVKSELERYLRERYKAKAEMLIALIEVLRHRQVEHLTGEVIIASSRNAAQWLMQRFKFKIYFRDVWRLCNVLEREGVLVKRVQGKSAPFSKKANGYSFLPWRPPTALSVVKEADADMPHDVTSGPGSSPVPEPHWACRAGSSPSRGTILPICVPTTRGDGHILCSIPPMVDPTCLSDEATVRALLDEVAVPGRDMGVNGDVDVMAEDTTR